MMLGMRTADLPTRFRLNYPFTFCFKTVFMTHSLTGEYHSCSNGHAWSAETAQRWPVARNQRGSSRAVTVANLRGPLVMQVSSMLVILFGGGFLLFEYST